MTELLKDLPLVLMVVRFLTGISIFIFAKQRLFQKLFIIFFIIGFSSDFLDSFVGRRVGSMPANAGVLDGYADIALYLSTLYFLWTNYPDALRRWRYFLVVVIGLYLISWFYCLLKFGSPTCYHPYSAKFWGASMFIVAIEICIFKRSILFPLMVLCSLVNNIEEISITYVMPYYRVGVPSLKAAMKLAKEYRVQNPESLHEKVVERINDTAKAQ